jgi:hypothetical protein
MVAVKPGRLIDYDSGITMAVRLFALCDAFTLWLPLQGGPSPSSMPQPHGPMPDYRQAALMVK